MIIPRLYLLDDTFDVLGFVLRELSVRVSAIRRLESVYPPESFHNHPQAAAGWYIEDTTYSIYLVGHSAAGFTTGVERNMLFDIAT